MKLTQEQQEILNGSRGETMAKVMETLVRYGELYDSDTMIPVTGKNNHLVTSFGLKALTPVYELMDQLIAEGAVSGTKFSADPRPLDKNVPSSFLQNIIFNHFMYSKQDFYEDQLQKLGLMEKDAFTCTCYMDEVGNIPKKGDILSWSESSAVVYANSVLAARCNRNSGIIDLMTVTGRLAEVMQTAPQALLDCYGANIPEAEIINNSVHNYLYGAYSGKAVVIANLVPALTAGLAVSALPVVAESFAQGNRLRTQRSVQMVLRITTIVCIPAGLGISALAQEVCELFFGYNSEVAIGAPLLQVLAIASIFIALTAAINSLLQAVGRVSLPVKLILIGSLVKLAMNYVLVGIPQINIQAAPWSTLACYLLVTVLSLIALRQSVGELGVVSVFVKPLLAGLLCAAFARLSQNLISTVIASRFAVLVSVAVGALVYLIALFLLKAFKKEDIEMLPKGEKIAKTLEKYSLLG